MKKIYFEYRYSKKLAKQLDQAILQTKESPTLAAISALHNLRKLWRKGKFAHRRGSGFRIRPEKPEKVTKGVRLTREDHYMLYKMAVGLRCSMAEVLRLALELYIGQTVAKTAPKAAQLLYNKPRKIIRVVGLNILDKPDHQIDHKGNKLDFKMQLLE